LPSTCCLVISLNLFLCHGLYCHSLCHYLFPLLLCLSRSQTISCNVASLVSPISMDFDPTRIHVLVVLTDLCSRTCRSKCWRLTVFSTQVISQDSLWMLYTLLTALCYSSSAMMCLVATISLSLTSNIDLLLQVSISGSPPLMRLFLVLR